LYGIKNLDRLSFVLLQSTRLTAAADGRTDRQTDSFLVASPRWHSMQRCKIGPVSLYLATICGLEQLRNLLWDIKKVRVTPKTWKSDGHAPTASLGNSWNVF